MDATAGRLPILTDQTRGVALGDLDGDGVLDLVVANSGEQNRLHLNDGAGSFTDATATHLPTDNDASMAVVLGDVDGDGDLDLVVATAPFPYGQVGAHLRRNDGSGSFGAAEMFRSFGIQTSALAFGDLDQDGDPDLIDGNTLQTNLLRQINVPREPRFGDFYELEFYAQDPNGGPVTYFPLLSSASANQRIPGLGILRVDPSVAVPLPAVTVPGSAWSITARHFIPIWLRWQLPALHVQALWTQRNAAGLTNASSDGVRR